MENNLDINISPEDIMRHRLEQGKITLCELAKWLQGPRDWDSVKVAVKGDKPL